jgi:putative transposase
VGPFELLRELAVAKPRWGSPRFTWRLRREGWGVNRKRIERLLVGQRAPEATGACRVPAPVPTRPDECWIMDFLRDTWRTGGATGSGR